MWSTLLLTACVTGLTNYPTVTEGTDTGPDDSRPTEEPSPEDTDDDTDTPEPTPTRDQIWLYTGHGGIESASPTGRGGLESITNHWTQDGWSVSVHNTLPEIDQMGVPRLLVFAAPGTRSSVAFGPLDVRKIEALLESEARIAFFVESCTNPHLDTVLSQLGLGIQLSEMDVPRNETVTDATLHAVHSLTSGIDALHLTEPCRLEVSTATVLAHRDAATGQELFIAAEHPSIGGEVIVVGDLQIIDDFGMFDQADHRSFATALADHDPETVR